MKYITIAFLFAALAACTKNKNEINGYVDLSGKWIEQTMFQDTLSFETSPMGDIIMLWRKTQFQNGIQVPFNPMLYRYKTAGDSISIELPSGMMENFHDFYFKISGDRLQIANFYNAPMGERLNFRKMR